MAKTQIRKVRRRAARFIESKDSKGRTEGEVGGEGANARLRVWERLKGDGFC